MEETLTINPFKLFAEAWDIFRAKWAKILSVLVVAYLVQIVGNESVKLVTNSAGQSSLMALVFSLLMMAMQIFISAGLIFTILKVVRKQEFAWSDIFSQAGKFWQYLKTSVVLGLMIGGGLILLVIPGIYLSLKYWAVMWLIIDKDGLTFKEALSLSAKMTENIKWQLLLVYFVLAAINIAGALLLGVGLLISLPVTYLSGALLYTQLLPRIDDKPLLDNEVA